MADGNFVEGLLRFGNEWTKYNHRRIYFDVPALVNRIETIKGIPHNAVPNEKIKEAKLYFDVNKQQFFGVGEVFSDATFEMLVSWLTSFVEDEMVFMRHEKDYRQIPFTPPAQRLQLKVITGG